MVDKLTDCWVTGLMSDLVTDRLIRWETGALIDSRMIDRFTMQLSY